MAPVKKTSDDDVWKQMLKQKDMMGTGSLSLGKSVEERDKIPDKACGRCKHFLSISRDITGNGNCELLKIGSDMNAKPPAYILEGPAPMPTSYMVDGASCKHFEELEFIDTDASECADQTYSRRMRQFKQ